MTPLLKKEIRLILPAWGLTMLLAVATLIFFGQSDNLFNYMGSAWIGVLILCASSFGREFSLGTFSSLLAQPLPRKQFWLIKVGVLAAALLTVLLFYFFSTHLTHAVLPPDAAPTAVTVVLFLLAAVAGGLWMALLLRQVIAVVWMIVLIPAMLCVPFLLLMSHYQATDTTVENTIDALLLIYSIAGIAGSWLIFRRAQDGPSSIWTIGVITLPAWLTVGALRRAAPEARQQIPWRALIWKELHFFNQVILYGMGGLFLYDLAEVGVRFVRRGAPGEINSGLEAMGIFMWIVMPMVIGCSSIAEERRMGTLESQLCQPVSTRRQFLVKLGFVILFGGLLSSLLPLAAESLAWAIGLNEGMFAPESVAAITVLTAAMVGLAIVSFFASSLTRNVQQAMPVMLGLTVGVVFVFAGFSYLSGMTGHAVIPGIVLWNPVLPDILATLMLIVALPWLAYRNYRCLHETHRIWRRNVLVLVTVMALAMAGSLAIYHRAWEKLTPFEPAHGTAQWAASPPPAALRTDLENNLLFSLPDGRTWFGCLTGPEPKQIRNLIRGEFHELFSTPAMPQLTIHQFIPGADWASLTAGSLDLWAQPDRHPLGQTNQPEYVHVLGSRETVGVRADGTLWVSEKPSRTVANTNPLVQFGTENDWQEALGEDGLNSVLLLKTNGTLWGWGDRSHRWNSLPDWRGLRACVPRRIGTNSDWQSLVYFGRETAQKRDGSVWNLWINSKTGQDVLELYTNFDRAGFASNHLDDRKLAGGGYGSIVAGIHADGTLWVWGRLFWDWEHANRNDNTTLQSSKETNWVSVALGEDAMIALKADGTLWRWDQRYSDGFGYYQLHQYADAYARPPARLGIHQDWIALTSTRYGVVSLAADGSLWLWRNNGYDLNTILIEPPAKPVPLGNILASAAR